ncbi:GntR family transcriptional regulator [Kocuria palustris]|uniref:GntR family transcriptional regulator n=1 Tax=Kocuria palustris TaxID=71999 RepID=UPI00077B74E8|nr:GntR family transcriptional regulator [Kocuria palustris]
MTIDAGGPMPDMTVLAPLRDAVDAEHRAWGTVARGAEVLRRGVVTGLLRPGARLPEERLAAELGISRNSLRAAFDEIEQEHLVERERHRGVRVCLPDETTVHQLYRARLALEGAALRWPEAGTRRRVVEQMSAAVETGRWARDAGQVAAMAEGNDAFHRAVVSLSDSHRQLELMKQVQSELRLLFHTLDDTPAFHQPWVERNAVLVDLVAQERDAEAADRIGEYLRDSRRTILELWGRGSSRG